MADRLRVAIVGAGITSLHLAGFAKLPNLFDIKALCSLDEERGRKLCLEFGIGEYTQNFEAVVTRKDIDVLDIATPPALHYRMVRAALIAGKHVICEKPLFGSIAECDKISQLLAGSRQLLMPIFQNRFGHGLQKLVWLQTAGLTGRTHMTTVETHWRRGEAYYATPWRGKWTSELGGCMLGHAIHQHDMASFVNGDIVELFAMTNTSVNPIEVEDNAALAVRFANGSLGTQWVTLGSRDEQSRLRFCFDDLVAESNVKPYEVSCDPWTFKAGDKEHQRKIDDALRAFSPAAEEYTRQFELYYEAVSTGGDPPVTIVDARRSLELVAAAYFSAASGTAVSLPIGPDHPYYQSWQPPLG